MANAKVDLTKPPAIEWTGWTAEEKPWDPHKPFHRFKCPTANGPQADGRGYDCGCRTPDEVPFASNLERTISLLRDPRNLIRTVPSWVPVKIEGKAVEEPQELEGVLIRSYQTWTDFPLLQYHRWYDWNFMVAPAPEFKYLMGTANIGGPIEVDKSNPLLTQALIRSLGPAGSAGNQAIPTMECEFDCGLFGSRFGDKYTPRSFGPMFETDWAWPTVGQYFWGMGRWIYDCAHPTTDIKNPKPGEKPGLTRSELHPCRAMATARWETFKFAENDFHVPTIQFMFFATSEGGYTDPDRKGSLPKEKIEFIVDLPESTFHRGPFPIGHTPGFPHNTIHLPRLLKDVNFAPFKQAIGRTAGKTEKTQAAFRSTDVEPIVEAIRDKENPDGPPRQVKVTIPFGAGIPDGDHFYGMILSLGWSDPDLSQARSVRKVRVKFEKITVGGDSHDAVISGEWNVRYGVNGRWRQLRKEFIFSGTEIPLDTSPVDFFLREDHPILISAHGEETDDVHDVYTGRLDTDRELKHESQGVLFFADAAELNSDRMPNSGLAPVDSLLHGREVRFFDLKGKGVVSFFKHCLGKNGGGEGDLVHARAIMSRMSSDMTFTFGIENDPLGRINPYHPTNKGDFVNPTTPKDVGDSKSGRLTGLFSKEIGHSAELAEDPTKVDYFIHFTVETEPQVKET